MIKKSPRSPPSASAVTPSSPTTMKSSMLSSSSSWSSSCISMLLIIAMVSFTAEVCTSFQLSSPLLSSSASKSKSKSTSLSAKSLLSARSVKSPSPLSLHGDNSCKGVICNQKPRAASPSSLLLLSSSNNDNDNFWNQQQSLLDEMKRSNDANTKAVRQKQYDDVRNTLLSDTAFIGLVVGSVCWMTCDNPFVALSYEFGTVFGLAYAYGLSKYVETIGGSAEDVETVQGAGVGQARFAFLILLFILVGKLRSTVGLIEIPSIAGFFTYQLASLAQALRDVTETE